jgi:hypothetical protein
MGRPPSPRTFTSPRTLTGSLVGGALPGALGATIGLPVAAVLFVAGAGTTYGVITQSPRWAPHCPYCDGRKVMGRAECWECRRRLR